MAKSHLKLVTPTEVKRTVAPKRQKNADLRTREHLTPDEVEALTESAKGHRYGHRDATMILLTYRHGLRAAEVCDLRWDQVDFNGAVLHVRRGALKVFRAAARFVSCAAVTMQTEVDIRNSLFPKEQVPASTPIPPRGRDHSSRHDGFLSLLRQHRSWRNERLGTIFLCSVEVPRRRWYGVGQVRSLYRLSLRPGSLCRPGKVEVLLFWAFGIVVMILSGAVAIYASHLHLWDCTRSRLSRPSPAAEYKPSSFGTDADPGHYEHRAARRHRGRPRRGSSAHSILLFFADATAGPAARLASAS
jgi:Phage integrase family